MKIDGFGISGYRSFGKDMVYINDLTKVNIFIGKNNSGKSNILRFCKHLSKINIHESYKGFDEKLDYCINSNNKDIIFAFQIRNSSLATGEIYEKIREFLPDFNEKFPKWADSIWLKYTSRHLGLRRVRNQLNPEYLKNTGLKELINYIINSYDPTTTNQITNTHCGYTGGTHEGRASDIALDIVNLVDISFEAHEIPAFRQITNEKTDVNYNGKGLINELRKIQSPILEKYDDSKEILETINNFLRELIGEKDAYIEIPSEIDDIYVSIKGKILPLASLGTGIHEIIILAVAVTIEKDILFCIEEPEIHIHPELQKKFIKYIQENTKNQYLITTHSNAFFDISGVNIYHCKLINQLTNCELVTTDRERFGIISDLGYKPSDLLQTNFIIWVEGPSDRIYLKYWIHGKNPELKEGFQYSIMIYGGGVLSHFTFDNRKKIDELIQLGKMNRNASIIIDSDKKFPQTPLNDTKKRIIKNFKKNDCFIWVTQGKEIENYIPEFIMNQSIKNIHPRMAKYIKWDQYGDMTKIKSEKSINKVAVAKDVTTYKQDYSILDLNKKIDRLIDCINKANL